MAAIVVDISSAVDALDEMSAAARRLKPAFQKMRGPLRADQKDHAKDEAGPDGKWPPLSARTLAKRRTAGQRRHLGKKRSRGGIYRKSRKLLGRLPGSYRVAVTDRAITATWRPPWSGLHNEGSGRIPQRQYAWISDGLVARGAKIVTDHVIAGFEKGGRR